MYINFLLKSNVLLKRNALFRISCVPVFLLTFYEFEFSWLFSIFEYIQVNSKNLIKNNVIFFQSEELRIALYEIKYPKKIT